MVEIVQNAGLGLSSRSIYSILIMSDLVRSVAKTKIANLPPDLSLHEELEHDDDQGDSSSASSMSSTGTVVPSSGHKAAPMRPVPWSDFFAQELYLEQKRDDGGSAKFHIYVTAPASIKAPLFVLHHGAGSSGMSFSLLALELRRLLPEVGILSIEAREHGSVVWDAAGEVVADLSIEALGQDLIDIIRLTQSRLGWNRLPRTVLVGHSLGGAVVTHAAKAGRLGSDVVGYAVLDVVEGSALETIRQMSTYLATRPTSFDSLDRAIEWHIRSRTLRNPASARASVPPLLVQTDAGRWVWRTDLKATEPYWENWFQGMSRKFLEAKGAKLLLLAGTDRLDKDLMIGQMQGENDGIATLHYTGSIADLHRGKFQLHVFPAAGHFIQEDLPDRTAEAVVEFFRRNDHTTLRLPPKVSELLTQGKKV